MSDSNMKNLKKQKSLRPTTGKVREALFDILRGKISNARFLDLYAGTGAVGVTALSEGAAEVVFVEENKSYAKKINEQIKKHGITDRAAVITGKVLSFIDRAEINQSIFDIIFLDPPYHTEEIIRVLSLIGRSVIVKQKGFVIAEHFAKKHLPDRFERLRKVKDYIYGDTVLSFYEAS